MKWDNIFLLLQNKSSAFQNAWGIKRKGKKEKDSWYFVWWFCILYFYILKDFRSQNAQEKALQSFRTPGEIWTRRRKWSVRRFQRRHRKKDESREYSRSEAFSFFFLSFLLTVISPHSRYSYTEFETEKKQSAGKSLKQSASSRQGNKELSDHEDTLDDTVDPNAALMSALAQSTGMSCVKQEKVQKPKLRGHKRLEAKREWQLGGNNINPEQKRGKPIQNDEKDEIVVTKKEYERRKKGIYIIFLLVFIESLQLLFDIIILNLKCKHEIFSMLNKMMRSY